MATKDPSTQDFKSLKASEDGLASVEVRQNRVSVVAGDGAGLWVEKDGGVFMAGGVSMVMPAESVRVSGLFVMNPFSFVPLAPALSLDVPFFGMIYMGKGVAEYTALLAAVAGAV